ncbi:MAG TPA: hypothetical protein VLL25_17370 [Acidimicrobiales bacterium]|nr:hypothetical protein [Acidimicrobiales bacterium]
MARQPVRLSIADAQIISELLDDLAANGGQLPLLDGESVGRRQLDVEEARAVARLRGEILRALGVPPKKARSSTT